MKALVLIMAVLAATAAIAQDDDVKRSANVERATERLRQDIQAELKTLPHHAWAGEYYAGDGLGVNTTLSISPKSGFVFEWHGCMGLYDRNYGSVTCTNDRVQLSFKFKNDREGFRGLANELIPVSWGKRLYLIPADDIVGFCNRVNDGSEPRNEMHGDYLLRNGDETNLVTGFPNVPKEFRPNLLSKSIVTQIVSVGVNGARPIVAGLSADDIWVTLDAGAEKGLRVGMELWLFEPTNSFESVRIVGVQDKQAEGIISLVVRDEPEPLPGWKFSTRAPWNDLPKAK